MQLIDFKLGVELIDKLTKRLRFSSLHQGRNNNIKITNTFADRLITANVFHVMKFGIGHTDRAHFTFFWFM